MTGASAASAERKLVTSAASSSMANPVRGDLRERIEHALALQHAHAEPLTRHACTHAVVEHDVGSIQPCIEAAEDDAGATLQHGRELDQVRCNQEPRIARGCEHAEHGLARVAGVLHVRAAERFVEDDETARRARRYGRLAYAAGLRLEIA